MSENTTYTQDNQFEEVLKACGMGAFHKEIIKPFYLDGLEFLRAAGVREETVTSSKAVGCLARYVLDTYSYGSNDIKLSTFFFQRLSQLQSEANAGDESNE